MGSITAQSLNVSAYVKLCSLWYEVRSYGGADDTALTTARTSYPGKWGKG